MPNCVRWVVLKHLTSFLKPTTSSISSHFLPGNFSLHLFISWQFRSMWVALYPPWHKEWKEQSLFLWHQVPVSRSSGKWRTLKETKLVQYVKVLHKWFTAMHSKGILTTGPMIIKERLVFIWHNENNWRVCILCGVAANFQEPAADGDNLTSCTVQVYEQ